jgi:DNA-binding NarL/FixJ family response regulator
LRDILNFMENKKINTLIADSQFLITESLKFLIQNSEKYNYHGQCDNFNDLEKILKSNHISLIITDFNLIDYNGFDGLKKITNQYPEICILILTNHVNSAELKELTKLGIRNIIYKTTEAEELFLAMDMTVKRKKYYSEEIFDLFMENNNSKANQTETAHLTPSELEIVKQIAIGLTTKEIAEKKHVSFHTVMSHRKNIFRKLNINNASELLMYAVRKGLIDNIEYYI